MQLLHRIRLDLRSREARRDIADPYELHSTLCRAFVSPQAKCPPGSVLWRLEPEGASGLTATVLVQSSLHADWGQLRSSGWLLHADSPINVGTWLESDVLRSGERFRFRLRANPCVTRNGKRLGLMQQHDQEQWVVRQSARAGFALPMLNEQLPSVSVSQQQMLGGRQRSGNGIRVWSVLYDGELTVTDPSTLLAACRNGIGHGKAMGLGLLSLAPARR